jgi:N-acyl-D-amino-acid deacylase
MSASALDLVIRGASVIDGTGAPARQADVALRGDRVAAVGEVTATAGRELDASGLALAPGFIDVHSHDDFAVLLTPTVDWKVAQGVTTQVVGNCGFGPAPYEQARALFAGWHPDLDRLPDWTGHAGYLAAIDRDPPSLNVAALVGHGSVRAAVLGDAARAPDAAELARMRALVAEGLDAGALGLSTGLVYAPGSHARTDEVAALAGLGRLYATHMRNEAGGLLDAVAEALRIGELAGVAVQVSHHKAAGRANWGRVRDSLALIEAARAGGLDATADQYPYRAASTVLDAVLRSGGLGDGGPLGHYEPEAVRLAAAPERPEWEGLTLAQLCARLDLDPEPAARKILAEAGPVTVILDAMSEDDVRTVLAHPTTMIGSDGIPAGSRPHPRLHGTFPRVLGRYVRELGVLPLETAVHRMTGMPAAKFGLAGRGVVASGAFADLVLFDPATVADRATYDEPTRQPAGIAAVLVNGVRVMDAGRHTGARPGRALRA